MKFGVHTSIAGGIDQAVVRAAELDCGAFQIFSTNPRGWKAKEISDKEAQCFKDALIKYNLGTVVVHTPYLINLASPKEHIYDKSIKALIAGIKRADKIGAKYMVLHPGSHTGAGIDQGIENIAKGLIRVITETDPEVNILLENVAGAGTAIGKSIKELERIIKEADNHKQLGICYDTCHGFAAGYDIREEEEVDILLEEIDSRIGLKRLGVIHANDSIGELGSNKDRHHHIGEGKIGLEGFRNLVNHPQLKDNAFILETPVDEQKNDQDNLTIIKSLVE
ncbi:endonuclease [Orenia metallireducens]|uniref:Probable endonuclease 4 n=1 Tax=Orenia metallireducens TaxID=1413210 RepID=A0A1C0AA28_9FIRM|nr:deoxyribonuclease IV [Orenia metallireducens]OCL27141.1 endonuclease [Orenia metallireducens]